MTDEMKTSGAELRVAEIEAQLEAYAEILEFSAHGPQRAEDIKAKRDVLMAELKTLRTNQ